MSIFQMAFLPMSFPAANCLIVAGNGGSGVVIIRYPGPQLATGGTITSVGGYTIHTFMSSGNFVTL